MDFYQSVTEALYFRMEAEGTTGPLEMCGAYAKSFGEYQQLMKEIEDQAAGSYGVETVQPEGTVFLSHGPSGRRELDWK